MCSHWKVALEWDCEQELFVKVTVSALFLSIFSGRVIRCKFLTWLSLWLVPISTSDRSNPGTLLKVDIDARVVALYCTVFWLVLQTLAFRCEYMCVFPCSKQKSSKYSGKINQRKTLYLFARSVLSSWGQNSWCVLIPVARLCSYAKWNTAYLIHTPRLVT